VARIVRATVEMEDLTNALLLLARETETGLPTELVSITDVVAREMEKLQPIVQGRPVQLETETHRDLLVEAPEKVIEVLLGNLLRNAASYTEQGSVRVTIDRDGVVVEDTGVGIAPDRLDELSQPFVRGASRRPGFGVGLAIVRRISDRFGWPVEFESEVGRGTRVRVRFPQATTPADGGA
jgi:signal transduction histidine kinase